MNDKDFLQSQYDKLVLLGCKPTDRDMQRLAEIIRCTSHFSCHQVFEELSDRSIDVHEAPWGRLSDAEMGVCKLIGAGQTTAQISQIYPYRSVKTIDCHIQHIKEKLGIPTTNNLRHLCYKRFSS